MPDDCSQSLVYPTSRETIVFPLLKAEFVKASPYLACERSTSFHSVLNLLIFVYKRRLEDKPIKQRQMMFYQWLIFFCLETSVLRF